MNPEQSKYERLWRDHKAYRIVAPGENLADHFISLAKPRAHHTVIDFGCGTGRGALRIAQKTEAMVTAVDFVDGCVDDEVKAALERDDLHFRQHDLTKPFTWLARPADFGFCTDVMEHIPPEDVDRVLANVLTAARRVYFCISTVDDRMGALIGEPLHLTVQPAEWWREKLENEFKCRVMEWHVLPNAVVGYVNAWATFGDIELREHLNVGVEQFRANVRANLSLGLKELTPYEAQDTEISLLCGGPSLNDFVGQIKGPIVTVNGAYNWAIEHGLRPGLQIILDSREFNRRFTTPVLDDCVYAICSQCDHELVKSLPPEQVLLWHGAGPEFENTIRGYCAETGKDLLYHPIPGGTTVALRALPLLTLIGFRRINVYGFDSCYLQGKHHAYEQPENDADDAVVITVDGKDFVCAPWHVKQAQEFQEITRHILIPHGVELAVHGDGLIAAIIEAAAAAKE